MVAASILAAACGDVLSLATSRPRSDLAPLLLQAGAPPAANASFYVFNSRTTVRNFSHPDVNLNLYLRLTFPTGGIATLGGAPAVSTDSVLVTVQHVSGTYEFVLGVGQAATFSSVNAPSAAFFYGTYGNFTGSRSGTRYGTNAEFAQALGLWREEIVDRYGRIAGSGPSGTDGVGGVVSAPGTYLVAALR